MHKTKFHPSLLSVHCSLFTVIRSFFTVTCSFIIVLLLSCRTAPPIPETMLPENGFLPLDPGASTYILADTVKIRPLFEYLDASLINNSQFRQMLDRTHYAAAAVYLPGSERFFQLSAWGSYPASRVNMAFGVNKNWKKQRSTQSGTTYWYSPKDGISVALDAGQAFVAAAPHDSIPDPFPSGTGKKIPEGFAEFTSETVFASWIENPDAVLNKKISEMGIPIELPAEQLFIGLFPGAEDQPAGGEPEYTITIRLQFSNETQARGLTAVLGLARGFFSPGADFTRFGMLAAILFSNPPVQDGKYIDIKTPILSLREVASLFDLFLL